MATDLPPLDRHAESLIQRHMWLAMGAGAVPIAGVDQAAVMAVQLDLVYRLSQHYQVPFNEQASRAILSSLAGSTMARVGASALKLVPLVGPLLGGASMVALSGASTYAIGVVFANQLNQKGSFEAINMDLARRLYREAFERGKELARKLEQDLRQATGFPGGNTAASDAPTGTSAPQNPGAWPPPPGTSPYAAASEDIFLKLERLGQLKEKGLLTEEEFLAQKKRLLDLL